MKLVFSLALISAASQTIAIPAFPGAEGAGANALGGRGGDVYYVTTLANSGPGSLREAISSASGPRTILFKVSGNIELESALTINKSRLTIAGQTAPGDGICLQNYTLNISADDVVVRHMRSRLGTNRLAEADAVWINSGNNIIVDHFSASWSVDEAFSVSRDVRNFTLQWSYITESLNNSIHEKGAHGYGGIISSRLNTTYSLHHNLYAHHNSRAPRLGSENGAIFRLDFRNNVIYNWGDRAGYSGGSTEFTEMNYVANYLVAGPSKDYNYAFQGGATTTAIHQSNNRIDLTLNGLVDGIDNGWNMFSGTYTATNVPFAAPGVNTDQPAVAYQRVLSQAGAMPWRRDPVDARVAQTVRMLTGQIIDSPAQVGGHPALSSGVAPVDSDDDGMPDYWETAMGLNTNDASDRNLTDAEGYTRLENYLNWLGDPHAVCPGNREVMIDLRAINGGVTNLTFAVAAGTNGTVSLLADGYTARFSAETDYSGLASFTFTANDPANGVGFGPVNVQVLVTEPDEPPLLNWSVTPAGLGFSWGEGWKLQWQTNSLEGAGQGNGWFDYPDSDSPVEVSVDPSLRDALFRLAPGW